MKDIRPLDRGIRLPPGQFEGALRSIASALRHGSESGTVIPNIPSSEDDFQLRRLLTAARPLLGSLP
ncbi:hypothetical protein CEP54_012022 [Fusarium duplospermum]|uniref:Uncharacterized protein n=1 Tax=Fusarium duplospermum TaxID=1325734 RepID=A0A428PB73_9HYPO|nr:hypothetical protein CEP54_012022 [Fusarium duplospermum]